MEIWRGRVLWRGYVHPQTHPHTQLKKSGIPHTHTHTQSMRGYPVKTGTVSGNTHGDGFICHLYLGETSSLRRDYQCSSLFTPASRLSIYQTRKTSQSKHPWQYIKLENHGTKIVQITITPDKGVLASLTWNTLVQELNRKHGHHSSWGMLMN